MRGRAAGTPCTLSEYQDLIVEFTKDERLHLQRMMQEHNVMIPDCDKMVVDRQTSDKEVHALFEIKTLLDEIKRRLPEENDAAVFDSYMTLEEDYGKLLEEVLKKEKPQNDVYRKLIFVWLSALQNVMLAGECSFRPYSGR